MMCVCGTEFPESSVIGIEYHGMDPNHYDGVSEWLFPDGHHVGRWTGKLLEDGEPELRYGGPG